MAEWIKKLGELYVLRKLKFSICHSGGEQEGHYTKTVNQTQKITVCLNYTELKTRNETCRESIAVYLCWIRGEKVRMWVK